MLARRQKLPEDMKSGSTPSLKLESSDKEPDARNALKLLSYPRLRELFLLLERK